MKKVILFVLLSFLFVSCSKYDNSDSNSNLNGKTEQLMQEANAQVGMPAIIHFQERKLLKTVLELRDQENLICYAYIVAEMTGKLVFIGKCLGYGIPYATEFTNPSKISYAGSSNYHVIPQADPNGLFMPASAEGTWIMLLDSASNPRPVYIEPRVIVSPFKLNIQP